MRKRTILGMMLTLALLLGLQSLAVAATDQLDQSQTLQGTGIMHAAHSQWLAQTFTAGMTGDLTRVKVYVQLPPLGTTMTVQLRSVDGGAPTGTNTVGSNGVLASKQYTVSYSEDLAWFEVVFDTPVPVVKDTQYAIVIGSSAYPLSWVLDSGNPYARGGAWYTYLESWDPSIAGDYDFAFETYVAAASEPEPTYTFSGFQAPVNPDALNVAKAGQTVPLKFRVTDSSGNPASDLTTEDITVLSASIACDLTAEQDPVEATATGKSGLQNLGDGYYQFNWATVKTFANTCRQLQLELGDGVTHTATFQFKK